MKNKYIIDDNHAIVYLNNKRLGIKECKIDLHVLQMLIALPYTWHMEPMRINCNRTFYAVCQTPYSYMGESKRLNMHDLIMRHDTNSNLVVDHVNHDGLDNRISNLRIVDKSTNQINRAKLNSNNTSGARGIYYNKRDNKWIAAIYRNNKKIVIANSSFKDEVINKLQIYLDNEKGILHGAKTNQVVN